MEKEWPSHFYENFSVLQREGLSFTGWQDQLQTAACWIVECKVPQAGLEGAGWGQFDREVIRHWGRPSNICLSSRNRVYSR